MATASMILLLAIGFASRVAAHGFMRTASADGKTCKCYNPNYHPDPVCTARTPPDTDNGYIDHTGYSSRDIICHKSATFDGLFLTVEAGHDIEIQWTQWPPSHHGYMMNALAACKGPCQDANLEALEFNMITHEGFISPNPNVTPGKNVDGVTCGKWALDVFIQNGSKSKFTVPSCLAPGYYIFRQELIALHSAMPLGKGAQNIPQCLYIEVTGSGTDKLTGGTSPMTWYDKKSTTMDIYNNLPTYPMIGPGLYPICHNAPNKTDSPAASETPKAQSSASPEALTTSNGNYASETPIAYHKVIKIPLAEYKTHTNNSKHHTTMLNSDEYRSSPTPKPSSSSLYTPKKSNPDTSDMSVSSDTSDPPKKSETYPPKAKFQSGSSYTPEKNEANTPDVKLAVPKGSDTIDSLLTTLEQTVKKLRQYWKQKTSTFHPYRRHARAI
ncbi:hypothetical protein MMC29_002185 [Sticta canariensis]|nr:hypothetical protein [Sticta canariensis]